MRILIFIVVVISLSACNSSRQTKGDYTKNNSRSKDEVVSRSQDRTSKKDKRASGKSEISSEEFLEPVSHTSSSGQDKNETDDTSTDNLSTTHNASRSLTNDLIEQADKLIGVHYRYGGTTPSRGFDCSGFTSYVFNKMQIEIPRTSTDQSRAGKRKKFKDANVGDLVFFGTGNRVTHVGIVVAKSRNQMEVIHSTSSKGVRRDEVYGSKYWSSRMLWAIELESLEGK